MKSEFWVRQNKERVVEEEKRVMLKWINIVGGGIVYTTIIMYLFNRNFHNISEMSIGFGAIIISLFIFIVTCMLAAEKHDYNKIMCKDNIKKEIEKINKTVCLFKMAMTEIDNNKKRIINNMDICKEIYSIIINDYVSNYYINEEIVINMQNLYIVYNDKIEFDKIDEISNKVNLAIIVETNKLKSILKDYLNNKY